MSVALEQFMLGSALPILMQKDGQVYAWGTGTLFQTQDRYYVVTADHVVSGDEVAADDVLFGSPMGVGKATILPWGAVSIQNYGSADHLDVAALEFHGPEVIAAFKKGYTFLTLDQVGVPSGGPDHWVVGYPAALTDPTGEVVDQRPISFQTKLLPAPPRWAERPAETDLFLAMALEVDNVDDGSRISTPKFGGVSGASIWEVSTGADGGLWTPGKAAKVIGVQTSARHGEYIRATRWEAVLPLIYSLERNSPE